MALFRATGDQTDRSVFDTVFVEAGDAEEMETRLSAAVKAAGLPLNVADVELGASGAGPLWQAAVTMANVVSVGEFLGPEDFIVGAGVAGNPAEARQIALARFAAQAVGESAVAKVLVAGAGVGPTFMALIVGESGGV